MKLKLLAILAFALLLIPLAAQTNSARMLSGVNYQSGALPYIFQPIDATRLTTFTGSSAMFGTLPASSVDGYGPGNLFSVNNDGSGTLVITCTGCTINTQGTLTLNGGQGADIYADDQGNYSANVGAGSSGGGGGCGGGNCVV